MIDYIVHLDELETYSPPLHAGTENRRLVPADLGAGFEMVHGTLLPEGKAHRHHHSDEWQIFMILEGEGTVELGDDAPQSIGAGSVVRIPPKTAHLFNVTGDRPVKLIVIYSPPLKGAAGFIAS
ncbi:MAG TPA: cupin domain-containing protein [Tianweitania sediminis]|jgi:mannose-6-phosphate isomerase-like protein (cupin superfamily)|nr:cupin domain-containing protein [Tianweitania sediminis]